MVSASHEKKIVRTVMSRLDLRYVHAQRLVREVTAESGPVELDALVEKCRRRLDGERSK